MDSPHHNTNNSNTDNSIKTVQTAIKLINRVYNNLSYYDLYGTSIMIFVFMTVCLFLIVTYCQVMKHLSELSDDWTNVRCNPKYMPFAGYINKPANMTAFEYTEQNFQYCSQNVLQSISAYALLPVQYTVGSIVDLFNGFSDAVNTSREMTSSLRNSIEAFIKNVFGRIMNILIPLQIIFIGIMDILSKFQRS